MQKIPIWSNPSLQRSLIQPVVVKRELKDYLKLSLGGINNKEILIFTDMEYKVSFYDATYGVMKIVTGLVTNVYEDQIKIKCIDSGKDMVDCNKCRNKNTCEKAQKNHNLPPMPICNCILNPSDTSKYNDPVVYFIPLANIIDVAYIQNNVPDEPKKPKKGVKVMILGISATIVKAIVIQLEIFDDNSEEAVKYVELQKGGIYDIAYDLKGTIYESRIKVINIEECDNRHHDSCHDNIVRENIGMHNSIYMDSYHHHDKTDFMKEPPVRKVKITVDTSETFDGNLEIIMLDSIRDCTLVQAPLPDNDIIYEDKDYDCGCNHN